ncbi:MAG: restriction endonuclease subunit S [Bacteroidetes bacterium]|nr:MAG: restriction endonuclease subunit S [Bacteroidota bacterium]MBL1144972.1 restriction endonuclease subunit S [Bacteroidota bacterium]NOG57766.1 hypothetical protein [Bacteroidota bacterium]
MQTTNKSAVVERSRNYKQTEVGLIPEDWEVVDLGTLANLKNGYSLKSEYFSNNGPLVITPGNFKLTGGLNFTERNTIHYSGEITNEMKFDNGDLLIVMTDLTPSCNLLGKPGIVNSNETILHNQRIGKIIITTERLDKQFLYIYFTSKTFSNYMKSTATGSTVRHTSVGSIKNSKIPLPPLPEQQAIAEVLSDTDAYLAQLEQLIAKKKAIKQGAMQELLKPKEGWEEKQLGEVCEFFNGKAHENSIDPNGEFIVVNSKFVSTSGKVFKKSNNNLFPLLKNDIVMVMSDIPNGKALAKCFLIPVDNKYTLNQRICSFRTEIVDTKFLFFILNRNKYYLAFDSGTGQTNLKRNEVLECPIKLPKTKQEQTRIANILSDMDLEIEQLETKKAKVEQLKQGMMQELLTGRTRLI